MPHQSAKRPALVPFDWESVVALPKDAGARAAQRDLYDADFTYRLRDQFSLSGNKQTTPSRQLQELDAFIISSAEVEAARIFLSDKVIGRLLQWSAGTPNGTRSLEQFCKALVRGVKVRTGKARGDITSPFWYEHKEKVVTELSQLQNKVRAARNLLRSGSSWNFVIATLEDNPEAFPRLWQNRTSLGHFFLQNKEICVLFVQGGVRSRAFFYEWGGWSTNRDAESFRQMISRSRKR